MITRTALPHWLHCCHALGWTDASTAEACHACLITSYSEPTRAYHTLQHLHECLTLLGSANVTLPDSAILEMALWFHDAIYDPQAPDNEARSATLAGEALAEGKVTSTIIAEIQRFILLTKKHQPGSGPHDSLLIDIDLAILGQREARFDEYEQQIRQEYAWVPPNIYRVERAKILNSFLQRDFIYHTPHFRTQFESQAKANLTRLLASLASPA